MNQVLEANQEAKQSIERNVFKQLPPEEVWDDNYYFDDEGLYGRDGENGIVIAGNRMFKDMFYIDEDIKNEMLELFESHYSCYREDIVKFLTEKTGKEYVWATINGCCQSDWNVVYYPKEEFSKEWLREIEAFYFGEINEYIDEDGCSLQVPYYEDQKKYIAEYTGCPKESIVILKFTGYQKIPLYKEV